MKHIGKFTQVARRLWRDGRGVAATEFAIIGPILILIFAGGTDIGLASFNKIRINEAVSSTAAAALASGAGVSSATVDASAQSLASILFRSLGGTKDEAVYQLSYNGGRTYTFEGAQGTASGSKAAADECRCPTLTGGVISWGGAVQCSTACPNKSLAGKYVSIRYERTYTPIFAQFGFMKGDRISVQTLALVQ